MAVKRSTASARAQDIDQTPDVEHRDTQAEHTSGIRALLWQQYCKLAINLHQSKKTDEFERALQAGALPRIAEPSLMRAALHLVSGMAAAGVRRWDFLPVPTEGDLADPAAWATQRLVARCAEQDAADLLRRLDQKAARALRQAPTGSGRPVYHQRLQRPLSELGDELERIIAEYKAKHGEFKRQWLDPNSPHHIAGVTNKEIIIAACEITGRRESRGYDENWKIVHDWLNQRRAERPTQPESDQTA
jgi:hypothetical protein